MVRLECGLRGARKYCASHPGWCCKECPLQTSCDHACRNTPDVRGKPGKAGFTPKGRIQQDGLGILHGVQLPQPGTQRRVGGGPLLRRKGPAGRFAGCALGLLFLGDVHTEHLVSSVIVES